MNRMRQLLTLAAVGGVVFAFAGCGDDECRIGHSQCVTDSLIRTCVPAEEDGDDPIWMVHQCSSNERCVPDAADGSGNGNGEDPDGGATASASGSGSGAACVGACEVGEAACVNDRISRLCVSGGVWQMDVCEAGEKCVDGHCVIGEADGFVQRCTPGATVCVGARGLQVCSDDGTAWVPQACTASEVCQAGECVPAEDASCDAGNRCLDNKTALRCLGEDRGFELVECEGDTYCQFGRCRGPVCSIGSSCATLNQIRECVDGTNLRDIQCQTGEVCRQENDRAVCEPAECTVGTTQCGDPRDPDVDPERYFTTCVAGPNSGVPVWVQGQCAGLTTCDPVLVGGNNPCRQPCTPGAQRCATHPDGIADGWQECQEDGTWGPVERCNTGAEGRLQCAIKPNREASALPEAVCAEPVCRWVFTNVAGAEGGHCEDERIRRCQSDGTLAAAEACEVGICRDLSSVTLSDGRVAGACDSATACEEDEERCVTTTTGGSTSRYQTCVNGRWSTELRSCTNDSTCLDYRNEDGQRRKICGAECPPGARRCNDSGQLETCDGGGSWGGARSCDVGQCTPLGNFDAACVLECVPGRKGCTGVSVLASDGVHAGLSQERECGSDGTWGAATDCTGEAACRTTSSGVVLGCVECIGPEAPGGNTEGRTDSRCAPTAPEEIQDCGGDNRWQDSRACGGGGSCQGPGALVCGSCLSDLGFTGVCTASRIRDRQVCGSCDVTYTAPAPEPDDAGADGGDAGEPDEVTVTVPICRARDFFISTEGQVDNSCEAAGQGTASSWGGSFDCCTAAQEYAEFTCGDRSFGSTPVPTSDEPDCCSHAATTVGGGTFAYCAP